jgi:hypothetical protein
MVFGRLGDGRIGTKTSKCDRLIGAEYPSRESNRLIRLTVVAGAATPATTYHQHIRKGFIGVSTNVR